MDAKVSSKSNPNSVAGMIANIIHNEKDRIHLSCVGAGALNQAIKAIAIARGFVAPMGYELVCIPSFKVIELEGDNRTAIQLTVEPR